MVDSASKRRISATELAKCSRLSIIRGFPANFRPHAFNPRLGLRNRGMGAVGGEKRGQSDRGTYCSDIKDRAGIPSAL